MVDRGRSGGDIRERGLLFDMKPAIYVPITQMEKPDNYSTLVVRTGSIPTAFSISGRSSVVGRSAAAGYARSHDG